MTGLIREYIPGTKITEPGAYANMPMSVYHGQPTEGPSISSSGLRTIFNQSLAHYWDTSPLNPDREETKDSEAMILGRAAHHLLLGEADFNKFFVLRPEEAPDGRAWNGNNLSCKRWLAEREIEGLTVLKPEQLEYIKGMSKTLAAEPPIRGGILNGMVELSLFWQDPETGIWLKSRPDAVPNDNDAADLKCVSDVSDDGISRALGERGYHQQAGLVNEAMQMVFGRPLENFFLVYVEQKRPNCVRIDAVDPNEIAAGHAENHAALRLFKRALDTGYWPGPKNLQGDGGFIRRTKWSREQAERRIAMIEQDLAA
ncbi:PD-(D/E)XK nuclease-like domain-containing protein [Mesorhizobium sp. M1B.F.Ca.ET.045.04.1.1]|uniref:PD-(D/E)XK nuclease-like domain-containing protein n=1 Tax=Mesorhizobium sp. M1B.F.Ca.ET.045.04.1.1 TaxID=2493673 RepID=UPI000F758314|nr:PD-(D/E)XK nuclease-like domain-containing protein [Mesorhizobium sp. M1B.F.Ca.ET.045.04.1.1]AZO29316.1 hypothetical protein EJ071_19310 [Mesorhizobium sp. M1B.F.Ca.ET.045.04.1.1]